MAYTSTPVRKLSSATIIQNWLTQAAAEGQNDPYTGKRGQKRIQWFAPVLLKVDAGKPTERMYYAQCRDISRKGIGVRSPEAVPERTIVRIFVNDGAESVAGRVRHCSAGIGAHALGIEFLPDPG